MDVIKTVGDLKPIVSILNKPRTIVSLWTECLFLCLKHYEFKTAQVNSDENISDYSSRHPFAHPQEKNQYLNEYISFVYIKQATKNDKTPQN